MTSVQNVLDRVQSVARIDELAAEPAQVAELLRGEIGPASAIGELETRDAALAAALLAIDDMTSRVMRIRLEHALVDDSSIGPPTRKVFASTIVGYANNLPLLAERVRELVVRGRAPVPDRVVDGVLEAARSTLGLRDAVRAPVFALISELATTSIADVDRRARDRALEEAQRKRWSAVRRDLEALAVDPTRVLVAPMATRVAALPEQLDEPEPEPEVSFADMIELD